MSAGSLELNVCPVLPHPGPEPISSAGAVGADPLDGDKTWLEAVSARLKPQGNRARPHLPPLDQVLTDGGDARIARGPRGLNRYGCAAFPDPEVAAYGSCTASTISPAGFIAAEALRKRLEQAALVEAASVTYARELDRLRHELTVLGGVEDLSGLEIIFGASGTDLHLFASQLMVEARAPAPLIIGVDAAETGRGVPDALAGRHFSDCAALGDAVIPNAPLDCGRAVEILEIKCRTIDGRARPSSAVDAEVEAAVVGTVATGRRVLLTLVDVSKTGLLVPSPACVGALKRRFPERIEVLVDACQFRLAPSTLRAYLKHDFIVALTGSKFITGPTFCGALLVPDGAAQRLKKRALPHALKSYSARADWPRYWAARPALKNVANYGLLLRWEAALAEWRALRQVPEAAITAFLENFAEAVERHLASKPSFELLPAPPLERSPIAPANGWDGRRTIYSFLLARPSASGRPIWLTSDETKRVHERMREDLRDLPGASANPLASTRCQVGQPVACGTRAGVPVSALRLCVSSRLIVDAVSPQGRGAGAVIAEAIAVLDKAALLASLPLT